MKNKLFLVMLLAFSVLVLVACNRSGDISPNQESQNPPMAEEEVQALESEVDVPNLPEASQAPNTSNYEQPSNELPDNVGTPILFTGTADIDRASEDDMARHPDAPRFSLIEDSIWMKFSFEVPVNDVVFVGISAYFHEAFDFLLYEPGEPWFEAGDLAANEPIFIQTYGHFGTLPVQAIGFTYADGVRYYIPFDESQMDGSLNLHTWSAFTFNRYSHLT